MNNSGRQFPQVIGIGIGIGIGTSIVIALMLLAAPGLAQA